MSLLNFVANQDQLSDFKRMPSSSRRATVAARGTAWYQIQGNGLLLAGCDLPVA